VVQEAVPSIAPSPARATARGTTLVTGAAGFIGSHVVDALLARGHRVVAVDDLSGGFRDQIDPRAAFVRGSILDVELIHRLFDEHRFGYVFHLAAYAAEGLSHFIKRFNYQNNLIGSVNLINAAIRHDGTQTRAFSYIADVAPVIAASIERPEAYDQAFNIGADRAVTVNALGETVSCALGVPFRPEYWPARVEVAHIHACHDKARAILGFCDRVPLEDGVRAMAARARRVGPRGSEPFGALELERHLPPSWQA
jgi:nucleoside-diphosphate-sugar epimerase